MHPMTRARIAQLRPKVRARGYGAAASAGCRLACWPRLPPSHSGSCRTAPLCAPAALLPGRGRGGGRGGPGPPRQHGHAVRLLRAVGRHVHGQGAPGGGAGPAGLGWVGEAWAGWGWSSMAALGGDCRRLAQGGPVARAPCPHPCTLTPTPCIHTTPNAPAGHPAAQGVDQEGVRQEGRRGGEHELVRAGLPWGLPGQPGQQGLAGGWRAEGCREGGRRRGAWRCARGPPSPAARRACLVPPVALHSTRCPPALPPLHQVRGGQGAGAPDAHRDPGRLGRRRGAPGRRRPPGPHHRLPHRRRVPQQRGAPHAGHGGRQAARQVRGGGRGGGGGGPCLRRRGSGLWLLFRAAAAPRGRALLHGHSAAIRDRLPARS